MSRPINIGVVGCGYWGPNLIRNFRALPDCNMKLVCDLNDQRLSHLQSVYEDVGVEKDFKQLLKRKELDAIVISSPVGLHYQMAKASLLAGKHTFVEKPMARSSAE